MSLENQQLNSGEMFGGGNYEKECRECKHKNVFKIPQFEIINTASVSAIVFAHPEIQFCEKCAKGYQFVLGGISENGFMYGFLPVKNPPGTVIKPPSTLWVPGGNS